MMYKSLLPTASLSEFVRNYTIIDLRFNQQISLSKHRSPKPEQKIVFYLKCLPEFCCPNTGVVLTPAPVTVISHQTDQRTIKFRSDFFAFIIFLQPGILHRLIHIPMMELLNIPADAELFFGTEVRAVSEQLSSAKSFDSMVAVAEQFLLRKCKLAAQTNSIDTIATNLLIDPSSFSLDKIAGQACLSTKQFYRKFTERIGLSPKLFSRLSRFNHAYKYKLMHGEVSWSSVALEYGYTDYHHLEKEFKEFTGRGPQDWTNTHLLSPERILKLR